MDYNRFVINLRQGLKMYAADKTEVCLKESYPIHLPLSIHRRSSKI